MSCDNENIEYWRLVQKYTTIPGIEPTIPPSQDHTDGTWADTDLYIGELFINTNDNKIWMRTEDGIHQISGTGGTGSFVGDYVPTSGGTYSGPIFAPTMSANGMTAYYISASAFDGLVFGSSQSVFYGDGSNLTGIVATWNGGTVSNPSYFDQNVTFGNSVEFNGPITTTGDCVEINDDLCVSGGVSASYFYGDGSNLTGIVASSSNYYTEDVYLTGSTLVFDRNDTPAAYSINLDPILGTNSIQTTTWNPTTNEYTIITNGGDTFTNEISEFNSLNVTSDVTATNFYGTFNGTFSNDVYTTSALLYGTDAVFLRTDGVTYSLDLSSFSGGGGSVGPTGPTGADGSTPYMFINYNSTGLTLGTGSVTLPITTTIYIGWQTGTRLRIWNDATHYMEGVVTTAMSYPQSTDINVNIDYVVGTGTLGVWRVGVAGDLGSGGSGSTQSLAQTLVYGNQTGGTNINLNGGDKIISDDTEKTIEFQEPRILIQNTKDVSGITETSILELNQSSSFSQIEARTTDTSTSEYKYGSIQLGDEETKYSSYNSLLYNEAYFQTFGGNTYQPVPEAKIGVTDQYGNISYMTFNSNNIELGGSNTDGFGGIEYAGDYSADYSIRSLVDKEYVDNAVSGAGGITYSGSMDYTTYFDSDNSLLYTDTYYNSGRYTVGYNIGWVWNHSGKFNVYSPYSIQPAIIAEGGQFGGLFIAGDNTATGQLIGVQGEARGSQVSGNLGVYGRADGTQSSNIGGQFSAYNGVIYPGYGGSSNTGVVIDVNSGSIDPSITGVTNSGMYVSVSGRVGDNNYIGTFQDGSQGVGKVLTCIDGTGLATWQTPTGGGGGTQSLSSVLSVGNTASTDIDMNGNQLTNVSVIDANGNVGIQTLNMINASLLTLMYNT